MNEESLYV